MKFSKLILASAIALSSSAFAMQAMDEESLSSTTGQDGIDITIKTPTAGLQFGVAVYDRDGFSANNSSGVSTSYGSGALLIGNTANKVTIITPTSGIKLSVDSGWDATATKAVLNIKGTIGTTGETTTINTGDVQVAKATCTGTTTTSTCSAFSNASAVILDTMAITLGATNFNMQLGDATPQGAMIVLNTTMVGGLTLGSATKPFKLNDIAGGGSISSEGIKITDSAGSDLTVSAKVSATSAGLVITANTIGDANGSKVGITNLRLGSATSAPIGNIDIIGLNMSGTSITISGH